jgi:large subunit ribosomal protein L4
MELQVINNKGEKSGTVQFDENIVKNRATKAVLHEVVVAHLAGQRAGTHAVKTRSMVSGGGAKPWKQKGTGRARSGSTRSPLWRKGGIIFGPVPRDYSQDLPKAKKRLAFRMSLDQLLKDNKLQVVEPIKLSEPKTKNVAGVYAKWQAPKGSLFVLDRVEPTFHQASRNIANVRVMDVESLNTYDCLKARRIFITQAALERLSARIAPKTEK